MVAIMAELSEAQSAAMAERLEKFESAWDALILGEKTASIDHAGGTTSRSMTFTKADLGMVQSEINRMRRELKMEARSFTAGQLRPVAVSLY